MYIFSENTCYIEDYKGIVKVVDLNESIILNDCFVDKLIDYNCLYYGSTYKGRLMSSKNMLNISYKLPIIISELKKIILFPIKSDGCSYWFSFCNIKNFRKVESGVCIEFINGKELFVDVSFTVFNNQMLKSSRLWLIHSSRV